uniref:Uncharacterized protein n=1 Tax=Anguilla anguilla TaxID=7936 RepID=A0A0E9RAP5_ANGAN
MAAFSKLNSPAIKYILAFRGIPDMLPIFKSYYYGYI